MKEQDSQFHLVAPAALWDQLLQHLSGHEERMAFGYCSASRSAQGTRLLLRTVELPRDHEYAAQHPAGVVLGAAATIPYLLRAKGAAAMLDAHSHPFAEVPIPSRTDDEAAKHQYTSL